MIRPILLVSVLLALAGCATAPPKFIQDPFDKAKEGGKPSYDDFKLTANGDAFWEMTFVQGSAPDKYGAYQIKAITKASDETKKRYDSGTTNEILSGLFGGVGGFCVGYPIGASLTKPWNNTDTSVLAIGLGSLAVSYLFSSFATNDYRAAVDLYNARLQTMQ